MAQVYQSLSPGRCDARFQDDRSVMKPPVWAPGVARWRSNPLFFVTTEPLGSTILTCLSDLVPRGSIDSSSS